MHSPSRFGYAILGVGIIIASLVVWSLGIPLRTHADTFAPLTQQMGVGARGAQVSELQSFLALSSDIYPQGVVSGYYGALTSSAVGQFQVQYGLASVGRVGPITLQKINAVIASGNGLDVSAPMITSLAVSSGTTSASVTWNTNENSTTKVYYDTAPLVVGEVSTSFTAPSISGQVSTSSSFGTSHSVSLSGLLPNTTYYYSVVSVDASGNVSMSWPVFFRTNS